MTSEQAELVNQHLHIATGLARFHAARLPPYVGVDDLLCEARLGLCRAAIRFDPQRGAKFTVYARLRIDGHIRDYIRAMTHTRIGRYREQPLSLDNPVLHKRPRYRQADNEDGTGNDTEWSVDGAPLVDARLIERQERLRHLKLLTRLKERHAAILILHYWDGLTLREIGERFNFGESRASQIVSRALAKMRSADDTERTPLPVIVQMVETLTGEIV